MGIKYNFFLYFLFFFYVACWAAGKKAEKRVNVQYTEFSSYREIPGVTAEEIEVIEKIKTERDSFVYGMDHSTEAFIGEAAFVFYGDVIAEDFFPLIYSQVSLTTQNPQLEPVISVVQKALDSGAVYYHLTKLYNFIFWL